LFIVAESEEAMREKNGRHDCIVVRYIASREQGGPDAGFSSGAAGAPLLNSALLPMTCHSGRAEESSRRCAADKRGEYPAGFFALLRMTG
jgi:hypothetical protein